MCPESDRGRKGKEEMQGKWGRNYSTDLQQKASDIIVSAVPDVPEGIGIAKRLIGRYVGDLQSDISVGGCRCVVPVYDDGHGKVGRG